MIEKADIGDRLHRRLRDLRISVTDRCNFRCGYCMPKDVFGKGYRFLRNTALLRSDELERLVRILVGLGVEKIRLTGGEPLLRKELEEIIERVAAIPGVNDVALTTNASLLTPARAETLKSAGVRRINISLDALDPLIYQQINQIPVPITQILDGVDSALAAGFESVKINMVVQKGVNDADILPMAEYFRHSGAILRMIEFMDVGNHNQWHIDRVFTAQQIVDRIASRYPLSACDANYRGEVAKRWVYRDGAGEIGVIASITQPFCGDCSRARLSAIGELFTCLFAVRGFDLRRLLRQGVGDAAIENQIRSIWRQRDDQYSVLRQAGPRSGGLAGASQKVEMSYIGG